MDDVAGNILGDMLRDDNSENLLGGNLLKDDGDAVFSDQRSAQIGNQFLEAQSQSDADFQGSDLLKDEVIFDAKVLDELASEKSGAQKPMLNRNNPLILENASFLELERKYNELEVKYKDQANINSELADKIQ